MDYVCLHDKTEIERYLRNDVHLNIYSIGDLDDFFWPYTTWYGFKSRERITAVVLIYAGLSLPTLVAISREADDAMAKLLNSIRHLLPSRFCAHLGMGLATVLDETYNLESHGEYYKMALIDKVLASGKDFPDVERLSRRDLNSIQALYKESYPGNWFDPRMLETNQYFGIREENRLVSIAGVHVYSPQYQVAALGNITTLPTHRNKGCGTRVTARLCRSLLDENIEIGLNVKADNKAAISCYRGLGFRLVASFEEFTAQLKRTK
jgi:predicted GNAT family acetyltransferase